MSFRKRQLICIFQKKKYQNHKKEEKMSRALHCFYDSKTFCIARYKAILFPPQLLFGPIFLYTNMFKGNRVRRKAHQVMKYLELKCSHPSIELRELAY